jgi:hypothetical protein
MTCPNIIVLWDRSATFKSEKHNIMQPVAQSVKWLHGYCTLPYFIQVFLSLIQHVSGILYILLPSEALNKLKVKINKYMTKS